MSYSTEEIENLAQEVFEKLAKARRENPDFLSEGVLSSAIEKAGISAKTFSRLAVEPDFVIDAFNQKLLTSRCFDSIPPFIQSKPAVQRALVTAYGPEVFDLDSYAVFTGFATLVDIFKEMFVYNKSSYMPFLSDMVRRFSGSCASRKFADILNRNQEMSVRSFFLVYGTYFIRACGQSVPELDMFVSENGKYLKDCFRSVQTVTIRADRNSVIGLYDRFRTHAYDCTHVVFRVTVSAAIEYFKTKADDGSMDYQQWIRTINGLTAGALFNYAAEHAGLVEVTAETDDSEEAAAETIHPEPAEIMSEVSVLESAPKEEEIKVPVRENCESRKSRHDSLIRIRSTLSSLIEEVDRLIAEEGGNNV